MCKCNEAIKSPYCYKDECYPPALSIEEMEECGFDHLTKNRSTPTFRYQASYGNFLDVYYMKDVFRGLPINRNFKYVPETKEQLVRMIFEYGHKLGCDAGRTNLQCEFAELLGLKMEDE
jgi:hypothetical protein